MGQVIGPPVLALMISAWGWKSAPWLLCGSAAVGIVLAVGLARLEMRQAGEEKGERAS